MESVRHSTYSIAESLQYFCAELKRIIKMKGVLKVSIEQVIEIERYCNEHGITRKQRIRELVLSHTAYNYTRGYLFRTIPVHLFVSKDRYLLRSL